MRGFQVVQQRNEPAVFYDALFMRGIALRVEGADGDAAASQWVVQQRDAWRGDDFALFACQQ